MRSKLLLILFGISIFIGYHQLKGTEEREDEGLKISDSSSDLYIHYRHLGLEGRLTYPVFKRAYEGHFKFPFHNDSILTIIDFSKPSTEKRLFVLNLSNDKVLYESLVAHGKNSGENYASSFSNTLHSLQSSPGFFSTAETYQGKHGYSLRLDGLEKGINDNARQRAIVIHAAQYVSPEFIQSMGRLGRSWGCPALPADLNKAVIDQIKGGSCLYIHTNNRSYLDRSGI